MAIAAGAVVLGVHGESPRVDPASAAAARMSTGELIGQRIVSGYAGGRPSAGLLSAVRHGRVGGVILYADNARRVSTARRAIARLQSAARDGGQPGLLVMVDQEGGLVKRIAGIPPTRSPRAIGRSGDVAAEARAEGLATARALARIGFNVNLAPVADVPARADSFLGTRAFSRKRSVVADGACAFAEGSAAGGVSGTFKHFPGLGRARANTDLRRVEIDATRAQIDADLLPYRRCAEQPHLTMIASASYPRLGIDAPAVLDRATYDLLAETGFTGLTVSDALDTPAIVGRRRIEYRAVTAGLDLLLYAQTPRAASKAYNRLHSEARAGRLKRVSLRERAARIIAFKNRLDGG